MDWVDGNSIDADRVRRGYLLLSCAILLAVGIRLYLFWHYYCINNDGIKYIELSRLFYQGNWRKAFGEYLPPLYSLLIAGIYPVIGDWETSGQFWPFLLGVLTIFPLYGLLRRVYNAQVAYVAIFFYGLSPYLARFSIHVRSESPYIFFLVLSVYFFQRAMASASSRFLVASGMSAGLSYLIRPEGMGVVLAGCLFIAYRSVLKKNLFKAVAQGVMLVMGFILAAGPYIAYLRMETGSWSASRKLSVNIAWGMAEHDEISRNMKEAYTREPEAKSSMTLIAANPAGYAKKVSIDVFRSVGIYLEVLHFSYIPFLLIGWLLCFRSGLREREDVFLVWLVLFYLGVFALLYVNRRYASPLIPLSLGWVAVGFVAVARYCHNTYQKTGRAVICGIVVVFLLATLPKTLQSIGFEKLNFRDAGRYLTGKEPSARIVTTAARVSFYSERPDGTKAIVKYSDEIPGLLTMENIDHLAIDAATFKKIEASYREHGWVVDKEFAGEGRARVWVLRRSKRSGP